MTSSPLPSRDPSPRRAGPLDQQALETVRAAFRGVGIHTFVCICSVAFAVFAAHDSPVLIQFLTRVLVVFSCIALFTYFFGSNGDFFTSAHKVGEAIICIGGAYYLITVSDRDFLFAVICCLGIAIFCLFTE
jgi:hypothetical protein